MFKIPFMYRMSAPNSKLVNVDKYNFIPYFTWRCVFLFLYRISFYVYPILQEKSWPNNLEKLWLGTMYQTRAISKVL